MHSMESDNNLWAMINCEPGVWLLMVRRRALLACYACPQAAGARLQVFDHHAALAFGSSGTAAPC